MKCVSMKQTHARLGAAGAVTVVVQHGVLTQQQLVLVVGP